jgi:ribosome recycling factor
MDYFLDELAKNLKGIISKLQEELKGIRSNRPSVEMLEDLPVSAYGQTMPLKQVGSFSVGQREILITVWDKSVAGAVAGAIQNAKLGFSVSMQGESVIRASLPSLTEERREEIGKLVKRTAEDFRVQVRSRRDETLKKFKAAEEKGELTEDDISSAKKKVQEEVDETNSEIEMAVAAKLKEIQD